VLLYTRRDPFDGHAGIRYTRTLSEIAHETELVLLAVPSTVARDVVRTLGDFLHGGHLVVHGIRGLIGEELSTVSDVVRQETPVRRVGAIGGPVLERELSAGLPSVMVVGSRYKEVCDRVGECLGSATLCVQSSPDLKGLEWASALTACLAIVVGYALESGSGPGLVAAFISRAMHEASRVAQAAGGEERTLLGLAGYGDLLASIAQPDRPEVLLGRAIWRGEELSAALDGIGQRVEAVELVPRLVGWAERRSVRAPVLSALARLLRQGRRRDDLIGELATRPAFD
jgi:glycerol-3-phosphate dehydrogenase (NAD(P)+)